MTNPTLQAKLKVEEKKRSNWPAMVLLAVTVGLSLVFYVKNVDWGRWDLRINWDWLTNLWGTETVRLEK